MALAVVLVTAVATGVWCGEPQSDRFHGSDGKFDTSGFLATRGGFLPVPIIVTEPAVGYGGGLAALFFHGGNPLSRERQKHGARFVPPSITAVGALATENGSKGGAVGHFGVWREDRIRYIGAAATASLNLDYWGNGGRELSTPLRYEVKGSAIFQRLLFRVADGPLLLGGEWSWSRQDAKFKSPVTPPEAPERGIGQQDDSGIGVIGEYETLDNIFSPTSGMKGRLLGKIYSKSIGGDNDRQKLDAEVFGYVPIRDRIVLGLRADAAFSDGDTPFYLRPYVMLRGLPAMKYSNKHVALGEAELRWNVTRRWSAVGFGGLGFTGDSTSELKTANSVGTFGAGFRYLIAERLGMQTGLDYARGPDDYAIYIIVGSAWR